jgi:hypothetical protein
MDKELYTFLKQDQGLIVETVHNLVHNQTIDKTNLLNLSYEEYTDAIMSLLEPMEPTGQVMNRLHQAVKQKRMSGAWASSLCEGGKLWSRTVCVNRTKELSAEFD